MNAPGALIFDFDGLILDTETVTYETVSEIFVEHGETLDLAWWHSILGNGGPPALGRGARPAARPSGRP